MKQFQQNHMLIVMADQLTALALGCYGHREVKSPHINRLAEEGVLFESAYSSSPLCTPARYAFMTGQHVSSCGGYDNAAYLPATMPTFAHYLTSGRTSFTASKSASPRTSIPPTSAGCRTGHDRTSVLTSGTTTCRR